jgi:hypothetical protein
MATDANEPDAALGYQPARKTFGGTKQLGDIGHSQQPLDLDHP